MSSYFDVSMAGPEGQVGDGEDELEVEGPPRSDDLEPRRRTDHRRS